MTGTTDPALRALLDRTEAEIASLRADPNRPPYYANGLEEMVVRVRAALAAAEAAPLDVDALEQVLYTPNGGTRRQWAEAIAREYAALRSPDTETADHTAVLETIHTPEPDTETAGEAG